MATFLAS